ncbi:hypothetical protein GCM10011579_032240 [Streptomyces albiflavescens]|uniref:Uncharacterized protein n=1 Tax=Streptomyces albiflavescens TaxID=1623582 RepID=A0A917Y3I7_9ACTN|nr:hypothetical protein GCM10011579_032240 [Streptomyces albiflavescens]
MAGRPVQVPARPVRERAAGTHTPGGRVWQATVRVGARAATGPTSQPARAAARRWTPPGRQAEAGGRAPPGGCTRSREPERREGGRPWAQVP